MREKNTFTSVNLPNFRIIYLKKNNKDNYSSAMSQNYDDASPQHVQWGTTTIQTIIIIIIIIIMPLFNDGYTK